MKNEENKMKNIEIGKTYFDENGGEYIEVVREHFDGYLCRVFEIDENGNETNASERILMPSDFRWAV